MTPATTCLETVAAAFSSASKAQIAVTALRDAGFPVDDIGIVSPETDGNEWDGDSDTKSREGAAAIMARGDAVGAAWGMNILECVIPGVGPAVTAGTLSDLLSRDGTGTAAGIGGALIRLGISESDACRRNEAYGEGRSIVTVRDRRTAEARSIFDLCGAIEM